MTKGYLFQAEITRFTPATGDTIVIPSTPAESVVIINPAGTLATLTIDFGTAYDGRLITIVSTKAITAVTTSNGTLLTALTTFILGQKVRYIYDGTTAQYL